MFASTANWGKTNIFGIGAPAASPQDIAKAKAQAIQSALENQAQPPSVLFPQIDGATPTGYLVGAESSSNGGVVTGTVSTTPGSVTATAGLSLTRWITWAMLGLAGILLIHHFHHKKP